MNTKKYRVSHYHNHKLVFQKWYRFKWVAYLVWWLLQDNRGIIFTTQTHVDEDA